MNDLALLPNASFEITDEANSIEGLRTFEAQLDITTQDRIEVMTRMSYHIHMILEHELWKHIVDDSNEPVYSTQEEYLIEREGRWRLATSTMRALHSSVRMARHLGYENADAIVDRGGIYLFNEIRKRVKLDRQTGEILGLKTGTPPDGFSPTEWVEQIIDELAAGKEEEQSFRPRDLQKRLDQSLTIGKPEVEFTRDRMAPLGNLAYVYRQPNHEGDGEDEIGEILISFHAKGGQVSWAVKSKFYELLRIL